MTTDVDLSREYTSNQSALTIKRLVNQWGFVPIDPRALIRQVDDQHGAVIYLAARENYLTNDEPQKAGIRLALARRDINEHLSQWRASRRAEAVPRLAHPFEATVVEDSVSKERWFQGLPQVDKLIRSWRYSTPFEQIVSELDASVEAQLAAANLEFIEAELNRPKNKAEYRTERIVNNALRGRRNDVETEIGILEAFEQERRDKAAAASKLEEYEANRTRREIFRRNIISFMDENPNGIDR